MTSKVQSQEELQELINNLTTFVAKLDLNGMFLMVNNMAEMASGVPREELYKTNFLVGEWWSFDKDVLKRVADSFAKAVAGEVVQYREKIYVFDDVRAIDFVLTPIKNNEGKLDYILAEGRDVTELEDAKKALEAITKKDQAILENIGEGIVAVDSDANLLFLNTVAESMFEISTEEAMGQSLYSTFNLQGEGGASIPKEQWPLNIALKENKSAEGLMEIEKNDGSKIALKILAKPISGMGKRLGAVIIYIDVTKEREVDQMKSDFISFVSHQLSTPLTSVKWFGELLLSHDKSDLDNEQKEYVENMIYSTKGMIGLIRNLLDISRIEAGQIVIQKNDTDLNELLKKVLIDLEARAKAKNIKINWGPKEGLPIVSVDTNLLRQVLQNLLSNAVKYTPIGGKVDLKLSVNNDELLVGVTDSGFGIPEDQQDKIFIKYFRAGNITKKEIDGSGLGLYLVKAIIDASGGKIWFESQEGKGSSFFFTIPL